MNVFISNLAGLWTVWVELDLFHSEFSARVSIVTEEYPSKSSLTQQLSQAPVCGGTRSYTYQNTLGEISIFQLQQSKFLVAVFDN